jgi:LysM repeat protein
VCASRIRSGGNAQKYFTFFSIHDSGMYQQVSGITPGARLRFSVYMQAWSTHSNATTSSGQSSMGMQVGIDPIGGLNPFSADVVWSGVQDTYDAWGLYTVEAVARSRTVTVFTRSAPVYPLQHNDIYLDDASLVVVGSGAAGGSTPAPTSTPVSGFVYIVQRGDGLYRIARKFGVSVTALMAANNLALASVIVPGQRLIIPGVGGPVVTPTPVVSGITYVVQAGDNLYRIALKFGTTVERLKELNHLTSNLILPGQVLIVG